MDIAQKIFGNKFLSIVILLTFHFIFRLLLLATNAFPFNSDEAIIGLMAKHILEGENFLYFYGQSYMGSVDAYIISGAFLLFGEKIWVIRLVQVILYGLVILFSYLFTLKLFNDSKVAFISALFLVFPAVNIVLYTTVTLGGYGEALFLGSISFYFAALIFRIKNDSYNRINIYSGMLGLILGLGLFINPLSLTMIIPAILLSIIKIKNKDPSRKDVMKLISITFIMFFLGSILFWYSLFVSNGSNVIYEIGGSAVAVEGNSFFQNSFSHLISFLLFGPTVILGLRPPWSVDLIGQWFIPFVLFFWLLIIYILIKRKEILKNYCYIFLSLGSVVVLVLLGFIFTSFGVDPSGRYFLPIVIPLSIFAGFSIWKLNNKLLYILVIITIIYHIYGTWDSAMLEPYITTQFYAPAQIDQSKIDELKEFLVEQNELFGFSNYWVSYPLTFISDERIICVPKLPYHQDLRYTERDNRISKYNDYLKNGNSYFYITSNNPTLDELLITQLNNNQVSYQQKIIGDYHIYYNLSKKITPEELGIIDEF